ncbi:MAG: efflux RND transporter permease subunit [Planctomycetota bacterium]
MASLPEISIRRPVFGSMIVASLVVVGAASYLRLGVDRFPSVDLPTVSVRTTLPGAATEECETLISQRVEEVVNTVAGLDQLRSITGPGQSNVIATFDLDRDVDVAAQDIRDRVATVLKDLPEGTQPPVISKFDNDSRPVLTMALSGELSIRELTELADKRVKVRLERCPGVGEVRISGGVERSINIWLDGDRLAALELAPDAVLEAVTRQIGEVPGGNVTTSRREATLRTPPRLRRADAFAKLVIATRAGRPIRLEDVGRVEDGTKEVRSSARLDGRPAVVLEARRQSGANTVAVIEGLKQALAEVRPGLPPGAELQVIEDPSRYIEAALGEIKLHLIAGSLLACLVVFLFTRSWASTLIAGVAIPCSTVATFGAMAALGFTLNGVTMLALVLMVGVVIDDAIVVLENVFRFVEEKGLNPFDAAREGTNEVALAVLATTISLAIIFVPVSFMSSVSGRFLYQFGITCAVSVMVSLLVSFTLTPLMSARLLRAHEGGAEAASRGGLYGLFERAYLWLLALCLRHRWAVVLLTLGTLLATPAAYHRVRQEYLPTNVDEAEFEVRVSGPESASVAAMDSAMRVVEARVAAVPGVTGVLSTTGGGFLGAVNSGRASVQLVPTEERRPGLVARARALLHGDTAAAFGGERTQRQIMGEVRQALRPLRELRCSVRNAPSFNIGGGSFEIDVAILGPDLEALAGYAEALRARTETLGGIVDADTTLKLDRPELHAVIDRERAARLGVDVRDVARALRLQVGGDDEIASWRDPAAGEEYDVALRLERDQRSDAGRISALLVPRRDGQLVRLDDLARLVEATSPQRVDRLDRSRQASLRASVDKGYALADRLEAIRAAIPELNMPPAYTTKVQGRARELERTFVQFLWAVALSIVLMYVVLAAQFESLVHPFTILLSLPLSLPFALISLWACGMTLNLYSALGILVLFGVVKKNAILQVDHTNQLREKGLPLLDAVLQANRDRLRPILMTTFTLVAGMLPLAVGTGPGAEERQVIAVVVIGGQSLSLLLTLLVTPVVYSLLDGLTRPAGGAERPVEPSAAPVAA